MDWGLCMKGWEISCRRELSDVWNGDGGSINLFCFAIIPFLFGWCLSRLCHSKSWLVRVLCLWFSVGFLFFVFWSLSYKSTPDCLACSTIPRRDGELLRAGRRPGHRHVPSKKRWRWRSWPSELTNRSSEATPFHLEKTRGWGWIYHQQLGLV